MDSALEGQILDWLEELGLTSYDRSDGEFLIPLFSGRFSLLQVF
jgi:hypothetical protein